MTAGVPPPFEGLVVVVAWCLAIALCLGAVTAPSWPRAGARIVRGAALALALLVQLAFHLLAPPRTSLESAGRLVFLWPAAVLAPLAAWGWARRDAGRDGARDGGGPR